MASAIKNLPQCALCLDSFVLNYSGTKGQFSFLLKHLYIDEITFYKQTRQQYFRKTGRKSHASEKELHFSILQKKSAFYVQNILQFFFFLTLNCILIAIKCMQLFLNHASFEIWLKLQLNILTLNALNVISMYTCLLCI